MDVAGLLTESFGRVDGVLTRAVDGLGAYVRGLLERSTRA